MSDAMKCCVVEDLLPNYIEHLTSEETNKLIDEHLLTCKSCKAKYEAMKPEEEEVSSTEEINYLKKIKAGYKKNYIKGIVITIIAICICSGLFVGIHGIPVQSDDVLNEGMSIEDENNQTVYYYQGELNHHVAYRRYTIKNNTIKLYSTFSIFGPDHFHVKLKQKAKTQVLKVTTNPAQRIIIPGTDETKSERIYNTAIELFKDEEEGQDDVLLGDDLLNVIFDVIRDDYAEEIDYGDDILEFKMPENDILSKKDMQLISDIYFIFAKDLKEVKIENGDGKKYTYTSNHKELKKYAESQETFDTFYQQYSK